MLIFAFNRTIGNLYKFVIQTVFMDYRKWETLGQHLEYPPNIEKFQKSFQVLECITPNDFYQKYKSDLRRLPRFKLLILKKYFNSTLDTKPAINIYFHILRQDCQLKTIFSPFGVRRFVASHILLGGAGVRTKLNLRYHRGLLRSLCWLSSIDVNKKYRKSISGKTVALVGGAPSPRDNCRQIAEKDLRVRLNTLSDESDEKNLYYFRSERLAHLAKSGDLAQIWKSPQWISIKNYAKYKLIKKNSTYNNISITISTDRAFYLGKLNAVPNIALDLLYNRTNTIYIYNVDLNLSKKYADGHRDQSQPSVLFDQVFGEHPGYVQFCLLKYLYIHRYVKIEKSTAFNIEWNMRKFCLKFRSVYTR